MEKSPSLATQPEIGGTSLPINASKSEVVTVFSIAKRQNRATGSDTDQAGPYPGAMSHKGPYASGLTVRERYIAPDRATDELQAQGWVGVYKPLPRPA